MTARGRAEGARGRVRIEVERRPAGAGRGAGVVAALALLLAACAAGPAGAQGGAAPGPAEDLRGTWTGTWGGTPLTLVITGQEEAAGYSGLYLGAWLLFGRREPGLSGVITFQERGRAVSTAVQGWLLGSAGLVLRSETTRGTHELRLRAAGARRLTGTGESSVPWGPQGAVELTRASG